MGERQHMAGRCEVVRFGAFGTIGPLSIVLGTRRFSTKPTA
jgi:hypothetical protein